MCWMWLGGGCGGGLQRRCRRRHKIKKITGFIFASLAIYIVSKLGAPSAGMLQRFAAAEKNFMLNK